MIKINYDLEMQKILEKLKDEERKPKLLLHSCCAPCSSTVIELLKEYFDITIYYYQILQKMKSIIKDMMK